MMMIVMMENDFLIIDLVAPQTHIATDICCLSDNIFPIECKHFFCKYLQFSQEHTTDRHTRIPQTTFNSFQLSLISTTHENYMHRMLWNYVSIIIGMLNRMYCQVAAAAGVDNETIESFSFYSTMNIVL